MEPKLIPFRAEHLLYFQNRDTPEPEEIRLAIEKERGGPAYTAIVVRPGSPQAGETILGCAGVVIVWSGMGSAWMTLSEAAALYRVWMTRTVRRCLADIMRAYDLHRLEAVIRADNERNRRWIEALGFRPEGGIARAYTPDRKDVVRYELIQETMVWS